MYDIFIYPVEPNGADIIISDPLVPRVTKTGTNIAARALVEPDPELRYDEHELERLAAQNADDLEVVMVLTKWLETQ